jgi:hypothetical protein
MQAIDQTAIPAIGDAVETPRFGLVTISAVFTSPHDAEECGYKEPTRLCGLPFDVYGKRVAFTNFISDWLFAVIVKPERNGGRHD